MDDNRARKDALANPSYAAWPRAFSDIQREHGFEPLRVQGRLLLRKTDVAKHSARQLDFGSETYPSEPVFVPRSAARAEDDGYLLSLVYDAKQHASQLVVLDAATFDAEPLACLALGQHVPPPFHGTWLDARWSAPHPFQQ